MKPKILIYTTFQSPRLAYVLHWIMEEQLGLSPEYTSDIDFWQQYDHVKINYSHVSVQENELRIKPHPLLQDTDIKEQNAGINRWKHSTILFYNQPGAKIPFDLFAAVFYLISRYEEYLPHNKDRHGRFNHEQSVASQFSFLQQPVVDEWIQQLGKILEQHFSILLLKKQFQFTPSYDIDIAWKYLHKGTKRTAGGFIKDALRLNIHDIAERLAVLSHRKKDPFDCFEWLDSIHKQYGLHPIYFMLLGRISDYDKNADPELPAMQLLMQELAKQYSIGIHPSYNSNKEISILQSEIEILNRTTKKNITKSRQHYIRFSLPETYERLIASGIQEDYSMGYASSNGFRAGTSNPFLWYNLSTETLTDLRVFPFAFMEATNKFYLKHKPEAAWEDWERLWHAVKKVNGTFISIWHNYILGTDRNSKGWRELYLKCLSQL